MAAIIRNNDGLLNSSDCRFAHKTQVVEWRLLFRYCLLLSSLVSPLCLTPPANVQISFSYLGSFVWLVLWAIQAVSILCPGGPDNARDFHMEMISLFS